MARKSSSRSAPAPARSHAPAPAPRAPAPAPAPARQAPPPAAPAPAASYPPAPMAPQQSGGLLGGLGRTMAEGFAFGTGSAIARNVVNSVMGGGSSSAPAAPAAAPAAAAAAPADSFAAPKTVAGCETDQAAFLRCLQENPTNAANCDFYFNALQACQNTKY